MDEPEQNTPAISALPKISAEEQQRRKEGVDWARGNVFLSGFVLDAETEALYARHVAGEFDSNQLTAEMLKLSGLEPRTES